MTDEELKALAADAARECVTAWLGGFDPPPAINSQQSEVLQQLIANGLFETALGTAMLVLKKHIAETERLRQRETDLLDANNRYLARTRKAEGALRFYADPANWIDTPPWDGDPDCITPKAIPVNREEDGSSPCDCGDRARAALENPHAN